jgi:glucose-6-phosphate isomerase, archaeal
MRTGDTPFHLLFNPEDGLCPDRKSTKRHLSDVKHIFYNTKKTEQVLKDGDPLVYEFYELSMPHHEGDLAFGTSITYPGTIGDEYFMTKGHFHSILETAEVYYCLRGKGMLMLEHSDGRWESEVFEPGHAVYVPKGYAHRSINTGDGPLVTFFCFRADAGHDYKTIESKGFRYLVVERNGVPTPMENPNWKSY